ncbi:MAG: asparagine synthase-related protein, partial [Chrysiogenales bacterium]
MGGWVAFVGQVDDFQARVDRFRKVFSVENVPALKTEVIEISRSFRVLLWAWNKHHIPDVYVQKNEKGDALILCGVITGTGSFCNFDPDQEITSRNILERWSSANDFPIEQLNGSFSCFFFNSRKNEVVSFVDRFASRSVWTYKENNIWIAGNFPTAIAACLKETPKIDLAGLWSLLHYGRHIGKHGIFEAMHCLLAGQKALLSPDKELMVSNWWERRYRPEKGVSAKNWGKRIAAGLRVSAERYKKVSPNPRLYLSGGLDSRIAAAAFGKPMKTVTLCTQPNAETKNAARIARTLGLTHKIIFRSPYWYLDSMDAASLISSGNYLNHNTHFIVPTIDMADSDPEETFFLGDLLENFNKHYFNIPKGKKLSFNPETIEEDLYQMIPSTVKDRNRWGIHLNPKTKNKARKSFSIALREYSKYTASVSDSPGDQFDSLLRWADVSTTYTYNMLTCLWPFACERNLCFDN